jgi:hypothetical protein
MKRYTERQLIEMSAKELGIPVEHIYAEIEETIKRCHKEEYEFNRLQHQKLIDDPTFNLDRKYWTDEYRQKCSERMKLYWQQKKSK